MDVRHELPTTGVRPGDRLSSYFFRRRSIFAFFANVTGLEVPDCAELVYCVTQMGGY